MEINEKLSRENDEENEDEETKTMNKKMALRARQDELEERGKKNDSLRRMMMGMNKTKLEQLRRCEDEARERKFLQEQHELKLGVELSRRKNEETLKQKLGQALRRDSIELRQLENQLRDSCAAEAAKLQLSQRETCRENTKIREMEDARTIRGWYQNVSFEKQQMLEARTNKEQYRRDLQDQLVLNHRLRQQKTEETRRERKLVEEANEVLRVEDLENQRRKRETAARLRADERAFFEAREFWKFKEKQRLLDEDEKHARILADRMNERRGNDDVEVAAADARKALLERMMKKMVADESVKLETEATRNELIAAEEMKKLDDREKNDILKKNITTKSLWEDMTARKLANEERRASNVAKDRALGDYLARERDKSVAADKRKDEDRRVRGSEYGKILKKAIESKRIGYAMEILETQTILNPDKKHDEARRKSMDEERSRMLEDHKRRSCKDF